MTEKTRPGSEILITPEQYAGLTAQALAAPRPTEEQRRRLRPLLAGTLPDVALADHIASVIGDVPDLTSADAAQLRGWLPPTALAAPGNAMPPEHYRLYRYFDACGCLLYVGVSEDPDKRDGGHRRTAPWYRFVARREVTEAGSDRRAARAAEHAAIVSESPVFNVMRPGSADAAKVRALYVASHAPLEATDDRS